MIGVKFAPYLIAAALALSALSVRQGYRWGQRDCQAENAAALRKTQTDLFDVADALNVASSRLVSQEAAQQAHSESLDNEARNDFDPCRAPSDASLHRLQRRWGAAD